MLRKQILENEPLRPALAKLLDVAAMASVSVTSEDEQHPLENAFDQSGGPGGTYWQAATDGPQVITLSFDSPQEIRSVSLEFYENRLSRSQEVQLLLSQDGESSYTKVLTQGFNFSPPATTCEREHWVLNAHAVTNLQLKINPDISGFGAKATLTHFALE